MCKKILIWQKDNCCRVVSNYKEENKERKENCEISGIIIMSSKYCDDWYSSRTKGYMVVQESCKKIVFSIVWVGDKSTKRIKKEVKSKD